MIGVRELRTGPSSANNGMFIVIPVNTINTTIIKIAKCTKGSKGPNQYKKKSFLVHFE